MRYKRTFQVALASVWIALSAAASGEAPARRGVSSVALVLDDGFVGYVDSAQFATSDTGLLVDKQGLTKDIANLQASEITFQIGADMSKPMYDWIKASMDRAGTGARKSGALIYSDFDRKELSRVEFRNALLAEVDMPALDAASTTAATMTIKIRPESTSRSFDHAKSSIDQRKQKTWHSSNFRLELGGLPLGTDALGGTQPPMLNPALGQPAVQYASVIFNPKEYQLFVEWQQALYCSGLPPESSERTCTFTYLDPDGATLFTSAFVSTGLFKLTPNTDASGAVVSYTAQLYMTGGASFDAAISTP
jgi:hypothetical protein